MTALVSNRLLRSAATFYEEAGFTLLLNVPTVVDLDVLLHTTSLDRVFPVGDSGGLVGSAEQSFLQMIKKNQIGRGRFQAVTECYRPLDAGLGKHHQAVFTKLELISIDSDSCYEIESIMATAQEFFRYVTTPDSQFLLSATDEGFDILCNGLEVGSYGVREFMGLEYVYGTGLALPRFWQAVYNL